MKRLLSVLSASLLTLCIAAAGSGCKSQTELDPKKPITLTMWHVYGEQADSPMNRCIEEFNQTTGKQKGVIINVTNMSSASVIGGKLLDAQANKPGALDMPDLFFCHATNASDLGAENLLDWNEELTADETSAFVADFVRDGTVDDKLSVLPISKSTHLLFVAGGVFDKFAADENVSYSDLSTWSGLLSVAEKYYAWSGGKPFCAIDYLMRCIELNAIANGASDFYTADGWYDCSNEKIMEPFTQFAKAIAKGHIVVADQYANTQIMTGQVIAGIGSSASILYYNDKITYPDNTSIDMNLHVLSCPQTGNDVKLSSIAGVGLCAYKTTSQKAEAATLFARWFTEEKRNLDFVASTGYMPVLNSSFNKIDEYNFQSDSYKALYSALAETKKNCTMISEPNISGYWPKVNALYDYIRDVQKKLAQKYESGMTADDIADEIKDYFTTL